MLSRAVAKSALFPLYFAIEGEESEGVRTRGAVFPGLSER
jgi:hypothetical protein